MEPKKTTYTVGPGTGGEHVRSSALKHSFLKKEGLKSAVRKKAERAVILTLLLFGIYFAVSMFWTILETALTGEAVKTTTDAMISIILSVSLFVNLDSWIGGPK